VWLCCDNVLASDVAVMEIGAQLTGPSPAPTSACGTELIVDAHPRENSCSPLVLEALT
jgi:hypothetical protein